MYRIGILTRCAGGANNVVQIKAALEKEGCAVTIVRETGEQANADAVLKKHNIPYKDVNTLEEALDIFGDGTDAVVITMCAKGQLGPRIINYLKEEDPDTVSVGVTDFPGARLIEYQESQPDLLCVGTEGERALAIRHWGPGGTLIVPCGYPHMDPLASFDVKRAAAECRKKLGIDRKENVFFYAGQLMYAGQLLKDVVDATLVGKLQDRVLIAQQHYAMMVNKDGLWSAEREHWEEAMAVAKTTGKKVIENPAQNQSVTMHEMIAACNDKGAVIGQYPTDVMHAAALGVPAICLTYPECEKRLLEEAPSLRQNPFVADACAAPAPSPKWLGIHVEAAASGLLKKLLAPHQDAGYPKDGKNAERVVEAILDQLE